MRPVEHLTDGAIAEEIDWLLTNLRRYGRCFCAMMERVGELVIERERRTHRRRIARNGPH